MDPFDETWPLRQASGREMGVTRVPGFSKERRSSEDENLLQIATSWYDIWHRVEAHYIFCKWNNLNQFGRNEGIFELDLERQDTLFPEYKLGILEKSQLFQEWGGYVITIGIIITFWSLIELAPSIKFPLFKNIYFLRLKILFNSLERIWKIHKHIKTKNNHNAFA